MIIRICLNCFRKRYGTDAKYGTIVGGRCCTDCGAEINGRQFLIKCEVPDTAPQQHVSTAAG